MWGQRGAWLPAPGLIPNASSAKAVTSGNLCVLTFQLQEEIKDWSKAHAELSEQIRSFERAQQDLEVALTNKDDNVNVSSFS